MGIVQVGIILGGNFLWWKFSGLELSGGNHPGGSFHVTIITYVCEINNTKTIKRTTNIL